MDPANCSGYSSDDAFDVWYSFTAQTLATQVTVHGIGAFDAVLQVLSGDCVSLNSLGCSDQTYPQNGNEADETITLPTAIGTIYYVRIYRYNGADATDLDFTVCVQEIVSYCEASVSDPCDEYVAQLQVGSFTSTSDCTEGGYIDYTAQTLELVVGEAVPVTVLNGPNIYDVDSVGLWVDWNRDLLFSPSEGQVLNSEDVGASFTGGLVPPPDALLGTTRLRVRILWNTSPVPCGEAEYGETEDYTVNVVAPTGVAEHGSSTGLLVFPDPSDGNFSILYDGPTGEVDVKLKDMAGRTVMDQRMTMAHGERTAIAWAGRMTAGTYLFCLSAANNQWHQRVVVR